MHCETLYPPFEAIIGQKIYMTCVDFLRLLWYNSNVRKYSKGAIFGVFFSLEYCTLFYFFDYLCIIDENERK